MAQLNNLIVTGSSRFLVDINGNLNGNAATTDNAAKLNGYASDTAATANTIVRRDANKYIYGTYFNANISNENINSYTNDPAIMFTSNDKWIRRTTKANLQTWLGLGSAAYKDASGSWGISITGSSASCTGNAATATKAINSETIIIDEQYYTTSTTNYIPFIDNTLALGETNILLANDGFRTRQINGTTSDVGETILVLGNNTAAGTAGNKSGKIWLYGNSAYRAALAFANGATANASHVFPTTGGTILNTGTTYFTRSIEYGPKIGTLTINGANTNVVAPMLISLTAQALQIDLISMTTLTDNAYINNTNGQLVSYSNWMASDYIKITANTTYCYIHRVGELDYQYCGNVYYAFYNSSKVYTHGGITTTSNASIISQANDVYVRVSAGKNDINGKQDGRFGLKTYLDNIVNKYK